MGSGPQQHFGGIMKIQKWDKAEPMTEDATRSIHTPADQFRVSKSTYEANTKFSGSMKSGRCYVIQGRCLFKFSENEIIIESGQYADLECGKYKFQTLSELDTIVVKVWDLSRWL